MKKISKQTLNENEIDNQNIFTFTGRRDAIIANTFGVHRMEPILNDRHNGNVIFTCKYKLFSSVPLINLDNIKYNKSLNRFNKYVLSSCK